MNSPQASLKDTGRLAELIAGKLRILQQIRDLTAMQPDLIAADKVERLLSVLAAKDRLLGELRASERELAPFHEHDPDSRVWRSPEARRRCRSDAEQCAALLREVIAMEQQCKSNMGERRDATRRQLDQAQKALQANAAYGAASPPASSSLDLTSE